MLERGGSGIQEGFTAFELCSFLEIDLLALSKRREVASIKPQDRRCRMS
jgi:hypothetical protein